MTSGRNVAGMSHLVGNFSLARQANFLSELEKLFDGTPNPDVTSPWPWAKCLSLLQASSATPGLKLNFRVS